MHAAKSWAAGAVTASEDEEPMAKNTIKVSRPSGRTASRRVDNPAEGAATDHEVAKRAYEIYESRGAEHGRDFEDWLEAERALRRAVDE